MINFTLYKRSISSLWKLLLIFLGILTLYISIIVSMFDPALSETLEQFAQAMPEMMAAVGMSGDTSTLIGFLATYLYGFILIVFPMIFSMFCSYQLIAKYIDDGSMVSLLCAPIKRHTLVLTQISVMKLGVFVLVVYATLLEILFSHFFFPGALDVKALLILNFGLFSLHMFISSICLFCSCAFSETKYSIGLSIGIPLFSYILSMLAQSGEDASFIKYFTFFSLFDPHALITKDSIALLSCFGLLIGAAFLYLLSVFIFTKKDLHI